MATLVAAVQSVIKTFYERLCQERQEEAKKVALTACMHKLLIILNMMVKI
jgi:transposase